MAPLAGVDLKEGKTSPALVTVVPEQIQSPSMTADWEEKLLKIEHGEYDSDAFMGEISSMVSGLVKTYEAVKEPMC